MKKNFNLFGILFVVGLFASCFTSCSSPANSGSSGGSSGSGGSKSIAVVYASTTSKVTVYDDNSWEDMYMEDGKCYTKGTWERLTGDWDNGTAKVHVTYSLSNHISTGEYGITIKNGEFWFCYNKYKKQ